MLARHKTIFIIVIIAVNICLAMGLYFNSHSKLLVVDIDMASEVSQPAAANQDNLSGQVQEYSKIESSSGLSQTWKNFSNWFRHIPLLHKQQPAGVMDNDDITDSVEQKLDQQVDKDDLLKASVIILKKLDSEETAFLYKIGNKEDPTKEELQQARDILLNKLTPEDINTLRQLGAKYGKSLRILDPTVPIN